MARPKIQTRLIVSFIGKIDIRCVRPVGDDLSPIVRLLMWLPEMEPRLPPANTRLLLLDEDRDGKTERQEFCEALQGVLPEIGLGEIAVRCHPITLPAGPTDLNALYESVWAAIPTYGSQYPDEFVFNISSGTSAMQFTLILASECLPLDRTRLLEASREHGVLEVRPPYVLAARERRSSRSHAQPRLLDEVRKTLLPDTVIDDPHVETAYAALYNAACDRKVPARVIVKGPVGSGKWQACEQFAVWRGRDCVHCGPADVESEFPENATLLIRHLDAWSEEALHRLTLLSASRPDLAIAATFRTDRSPVAPPLAVGREGLRGAIPIELPALGVRSDIVALGEALARRLGIHDGKLKERLQHDLLTDVYPQGLHDLGSLLATAAAMSTGIHPQRSAYVQARNIRNAEALQAEAWRILAGLDFGPGRPDLEEVFDIIRATTVQRLQCGRNQTEIGNLLGISQSRVSEILGQSLDLSAWQSGSHSVDESV